MKKLYLLSVCAALFLTVSKLSAQCAPAFYDSFESGSYTPTWTIGSGLTSAAVTTTNPAVGTYRLEGTGGTTTHLTGLSTTIASATPSTISWYIYPTGTVATNYFVAGDNAVTATNCVMFCYWVGSASAIRFVSSSTYQYVATPGQWYHIEMRNINWSTHVFDIYINNVLMQTAFPFRSATQNSITKLHLYNFNSGVGVWDDIMIGGAPPIVLSNTNSSVSCNGGNNGTIDLTPSGGTPGYTYSWSNGGTSQDLTGLTAGTYSVLVTDAASCTQTATVVITEPTAIVSTTSSTPVSCNGGTNGSASISVSGGAGSYSYIWSSSSTSASTTNLAAGTYTCIVTDGSGCTHIDSVNVTEPTAIVSATSQNDVLCNGGNNADATVTVSGGTSPYTYAWSSGGTGATESNLTAGTYTCTITDANGCMNIQSVTITEPTALAATAAQTNVNCNGAASGDATITATGGTGVYTYAWSSGGTNYYESNLAAGTYTCVITDANNCSTSTIVTITEPAALVSSSTQTNILCNGGNNGSATVTAIGGTGSYAYNWSSGGTAATESSLVAGTYICTITDSLGCSVNDTIVISEPDTLLANGTVTGTSGCGGTDGSISVNTSGGTPGYTYLWSNSANTEDITGLAAGVYQLTVTDTNGCSYTTQFMIDDPAAPTVFFDNNTDSVCVNDASFALAGGLPAGGVYSGPGVSGGMFDPSNANSGYNVITYTYTAPNGCTGSVNDSIWVDLCSGIENQMQQTSISLYPNPTSGEVFINPGAMNGMISVEVFAADGRLVLSKNEMAASVLTISLADQPAGIYTVRLSDSKTVSTARIIRQ